MGCALLPDETKERLGCGKHQFPNRDRRQASPLASPQQPMDHVFLRGLNPPKRCRPLLSKVDLNGSRFYGNRRKTDPRWFFREPQIPEAASSCPATCLGEPFLLHPESPMMRSLLRLCAALSILAAT